MLMKGINHHWNGWSTYTWPLHGNKRRATGGWCWSNVLPLWRSCTFSTNSIISHQEARPCVGNLVHLDYGDDARVLRTISIPQPAPWLKPSIRFSSGKFKTLTDAMQTTQAGMALMHNHRQIHATLIRKTREMERKAVHPCTGLT